MRSLRHSITICTIAFFTTTNLFGQFGPQVQIFCNGPRSVGLADINSDGHLDLMIASRQGLAVYLNTDGLGTWDQPLVIGVAETVGCLVDVDADGLPDVVGSADNGGGLYVHRNMGSMVFGIAVPFAGGYSANEIQHADLDGDGDQDVLFASDAGQLIACYNIDGFGTFDTPQVLASLVGLAYPQVLDIDGDGDQDILYSSNVASEVDLCRNNNGIFGAPEQLTLAGHGISKDLDNDGHPDALTVNTAAGTVRWQRNTDGAGDLSSPATLDPAFSAPEFVNASDVDGDGDMDAIVSSSTQNEVAWFANVDGQGSFGPRQTIAYDIPTTAIATGDIDGDGDEDLFVASATLDKVIQYSNLANANGKIMGRVFNDINSDGIFNGNDHGLMNVRVESTDLGATYTNASGFYWYNAVPTNYTVSLPPVANWTLTTVDQYSVTVPTLGSSQNNDFGLHADGIVSELTPDLGSSPLRCGESVHYWGTVQNTGNQVSDVQLTLNLDALNAFVWSNPMPTSIDGGIATWIFTNVQPTHQRSLDVVVHLPPSSYVGDTLHDRLHAIALINGIPQSTHIAAYDPRLVCAIDPNDKTVLPEGLGAEHLTAMDAVLTYSVRFQNTGNAAANTVTILDTLDSNMDPSSLRIIASSHTQRTLIETNGVVHFIFDNINLPDSGTDQLASQGFVRFSIHHHDGLAEGTQLKNTAGIYFDNNAPVITNTTLNTLTNSMQTSVAENMMSGGSDMTVFPNPSQGTATVRLSDDFQGRVDVALFDVSGSEVLRTSRRANTVLIDRGTLPDGVYLLRATDERGTERTTRLVFER